MDNLGYIDFIILAIIVFFAIKGFFAGFIRELSGIIGLILGIVLASIYAHDAGIWFKEKVFGFDSATLNTFVGFILIYLFVWVATFLASKLVLKFTPHIKYFNGLLGVLFGAIKAFLAIAIALHFAFRLEFMSGVLTHFGNHSEIYPGMESIASKIVATDIIKYIPKDTKEAEQKLNEIKDEATESIEETDHQVEQTIQIFKDSNDV